MHTSRLSQLAIAIASASALLFAGMPLFAKMGALPSRLSFPLFLLGGLLGLAALLLALIALYTTRPATGRAGRGLAWSAFAIGVAVLGGIAFAAGSSADCRRSTTSPPIPAIRRSSRRSRTRARTRAAT